MIRVSRRFHRLDERALEGVLARHPGAVLVNRRLEGGEACSVLVDDELGGRLVVAHLLAAGRRRIGFLAGPVASRSGRLRARGYRAALDAARQPYDATRVLPCAPVVEGGYRAARELLARDAALAALFCYNDLVAVGALQACVELGLAVPGDLAVAGYDDIPLAALVTPPLTTCRVPRYDLGARAVRLLLDRLDGGSEGDPGACAPEFLPPELVVRASAPDSQGVEEP